MMEMFGFSLSRMLPFFRLFLFNLCPVCGVILSIQDMFKFKCFAVTLPFDAVRQLRLAETVPAAKTPLIRIPTLYAQLRRRLVCQRLYETIGQLKVGD